MYLVLRDTQTKEEGCTTSIPMYQGHLFLIALLACTTSLLLNECDERVSVLSGEVVLSGKMSEG